MFTSLPIEIVRYHIVPELFINDALKFVMTNKLYYSLYTNVVERVINRINTLIDYGDNMNNLKVHKCKYDFKSTITYLSQIGVIAGGSMVYALNEHVDIHNVNDINIYLPTKDAFMQAYAYLMETEQVISINKFKNRAYNSQKFNDEKYIVSIVNLVLKTRKYIQLLYFEFETPFDIIKTFDLDYVQCALYKGHIYRTLACIESHRRRQILKGYQNLKLDRLEKAQKKGFLTPLFGKYRSSSVTATYGNLEEILSPFQPKKNLGEFDINSIQITRIENGDSKSTLNDDYVKYQPCKVNIYYTINDINFSNPSSIIIEINVIDFSDKYQFYNIQPIQIGTYTVNTSRSKYQHTKLDIGKNIVSSELIWTNIPRLKFNVIEKITETMLTIPMKFSENIITSF